MAIYYTSDAHFFHEDIIGACNRPFSDVDSMNAALVERWNVKVNENDEVYIVGDFGVCDEKQAEQLIDTVNKLHGRKHLITGNHDSALLQSIPKLASSFESISQMAKIRDGRNSVTLCHYPMMEWEGFDNKRSYLVYGHIHNFRSSRYWPLLCMYGNALNAGVDVNSYEPCTLGELIANNKRWKNEAADGENVFLSIDQGLAFEAERVFAAEKRTLAEGVSDYLVEIIERGTSKTEDLFAGFDETDRNNW